MYATTWGWHGWWIPQTARQQRMSHCGYSDVDDDEKEEENDGDGKIA